MGKKIKIVSQPKLFLAFFILSALTAFWFQSTKWFRLKLADHYDRRKQEEKVVQIYERVIRKDNLKTKNPLALNLELTNSEKQNIYRTLGNFYFQNDVKDKAINSYEILRRIYPDKIEDYLNLYILTHDPKKIVKYILGDKEELLNSLPEEYLRSPLWKFYYAAGLAEKQRLRESKIICSSLVEEFPYLGCFKKLLESIENKTVLNSDFNIVGIWKLDKCDDGIAKDYSGMRNSGKVYGARSVKGIKGYALSFDGEHNSLVIEEDSSLDLSGKDFTIAMWIKPSFQAKYRFVYYKSHPNLRLYKNNRMWSFELHDEVRNKPVKFRLPIEDKWYFIVQRVVQNQAHGAWIFGRKGLIQFRERNDIHIVSDSNGRKFRLGSRKNWNGIRNTCFKGIIDEVYIFKQALTKEEIEGLYRSYL